MKRFYQVAFLLAGLAVSAGSLAQPYRGTIFFDPDVITADDPSAVVSTTYTGQGTRRMFDRRLPGWDTVNVYLFDIVFDDGLTTEAQVNDEFGTLEAATAVAKKYAEVVGKLPTCLRTDVDALWINTGTMPFGGGNRSLLIYTGQSAKYEEQGILEETLIHEASHTSLDATHARAEEWKKAAELDGKFISNYAASNPYREDIAETFLMWIAVRQPVVKISEKDFSIITETVPNRLIYFDRQNLNMYPLKLDVPRDSIRAAIPPTGGK
jgi:hypothetical protein